MVSIRLLARAGDIGLALAMLSFAPARAQEITPSHLAAARDAAALAQTFQRFNDVLPLLSRKVQDRLIRLRPDLYKQITDTVEATALTMASRRSELDNEIAKVWAEAFTEDELNQIIAFYKSPTGQKFINVGPKVVQDSMQTVQAWSDKMGNELLAKSRDELKKQGVEF